MKILNISGVFIAAALLLFVFVAKFSAVESRFQCSGEIAAKDGSRSVSVYLKLEKYRWWVGLWSESDASLHLEIPNSAIEYFGHVKIVGDQYQIFDDRKNLKGNFSTLSKTLALSTSAGFFDGVCKKTE
jgi:hypothetical protein